jgi:tetratricopeptide (TPR) repeat protein
MNKSVSSLLSEGFTALNRGDLQTAGTCCQQALDQDPENPQAHFLVGLVALEASDRPNAHRAFKSVVRLDPDHAAAWSQLARLNASEGRVKLAEQALLETRRLKPTDPTILDTIGTVLTQLGEYDAAKAFFARATTSAPHTPHYMLNLANNLVFLGEIDTAKAIFEDVIQLQANTPQAHWGFASAVKAESNDHIDQMRTLLERNRENPRGLGFLHYAIGKELEDLTAWPEAFEAFAAGAAARRQTVAFDEPTEQTMFDALQSTYTRSWLEKCAPGNPDPSPIFVLGQPRTGTTLIERIITSHSEVHSAGELQQFGLAIRRLAKIQDPRRYSPELLEAAAALDPAQLGTTYLQSSTRMRGKMPRFVDKLPVNYLNIGLILAALPNAKIVHLVRGPMDACFASFKQLFADAYLHSYDQEEMARHHVRYRNLMAHWHREFPGRIIDISYEATAADLEPNARQLIAALELEWEDACLNFHESSAGVATASAVQVREPAHTRSIGRWRRYETQLAPMRQTLEDAGVPLDL